MTDDGWREKPFEVARCVARFNYEYDVLDPTVALVCQRAKGHSGKHQMVGTQFDPITDVEREVHEYTFEWSSTHEVAQRVWPSDTPASQHIYEELKETTPDA